jgi:hypothetical protein
MKDKRYLGLLFVLVALPLAAACGSSVATGGSGAGGSAGGAGGAGGGTGGAGGDETITLTCHVDTVKYPPVHKGCAAAADCAVAVYTTDCCGTLAAVGIDADDYPSIEMAETACKNGAICDCVPMPTKAEDGKSGDLAAIQLACDMGVCTTFLP